MMKLKQIKTIIAFMLMGLPMRRQHRKFFAKWGGVNTTMTVFIGKKVSFDTMYPQNITLANNVHIANGCVFLAHYLDTSRNGIFFIDGQIEVGNDVFIGTNTIICRPVRIGNNVIIGVGSVVTKDIPDNEIWAGNPAHLIKKR